MGREARPATREGSVERCSSRPLKAQDDLGRWRRGRSGGNKGQAGCGKHRACPGNQEGTHMAGWHGDKATKAVRAVLEGP